MTTIVSPASSPQPVYNRGGTTVTQVSATIDGVGGSQTVGGAGGKLFRKVASAAWQFIGG